MFPGEFVDTVLLRPKPVDGILDSRKSMSGPGKRTGGWKSHFSRPANLDKQMRLPVKNPDEPARGTIVAARPRTDVGR